MLFGNKLCGGGKLGDLGLETDGEVENFAAEDGDGNGLGFVAGCRDGEPAPACPEFDDLEIAVFAGEGAFCVLFALQDDGGFFDELTGEVVGDDAPDAAVMDAGVIDGGCGAVAFYEIRILIRKPIDEKIELGDVATDIFKNAIYVFAGDAGVAVYNVGFADAVVESDGKPGYFVECVLCDGVVFKLRFVEEWCDDADKPVDKTEYFAVFEMGDIAGAVLYGVCQLLIADGDGVGGCEFADTVDPGGNFGFESAFFFCNSFAVDGFGRRVFVEAFVVCQHLFPHFAEWWQQGAGFFILD